MIDATQKVISHKVGLLNLAEDWLVKYNTERTHQGEMCCCSNPVRDYVGRKKYRAGEARSLDFI